MAFVYVLMNQRIESALSMKAFFISTVSVQHSKQAKMKESFMRNQPRNFRFRTCSLFLKSTVILALLPEKLSLSLH